MGLTVGWEGEKQVGNVVRPAILPATESENPSGRSIALRRDRSGRGKLSKVLYVGGLISHSTTHTRTREDEAVRSAANDSPASIAVLSSVVTNSSASQEASSLHPHILIFPRQDSEPGPSLYALG